MAKTTTAGKGSSRRKKPTETVEDAKIVEETGDAAVTEAAEEAAAQPDVAGEDSAAPDDLGTPAAESGDDEITEAGATAEETTETGETMSETDEAARAHPAPAPMPVAAETSQGGGAVALIFGGVVAGAIGFFAAYIGLGINQDPPPEPVDLSGLEQSIEMQSGRLDDLAASIPEASAAPDLSGIDAQLAELGTAVSGLDTRITALENSAPGEASVVDPALLEDLDALKSTLAALEAENETAKANARSAAEATLQRAAMTRVQTALDTGAPFADAMAELQNLGVEVPEPLAQAAADGVTTLASLQDAFPDAARAALAADREASAEAGDTGGLTGFLRSQLGARSLTPQEGDSTDAVLSRAEAALREGRLTDALAEIETLPEVAQPALSGWAGMAATRADTVSAAQTLSDSLN